MDQQIRKQYEAAPLSIIRASVLLNEKQEIFASNALKVVFEVLDRKTDEYLIECAERFGRLDGIWERYRRMGVKSLHSEITRLRDNGPLHECLIAERVARQRGFPYRPLVN